MTSSRIEVIRGQPVLILNEKSINPSTAYVGPAYASRFLEAGIRLFTFHVPGKWWLGPGQFDISGMSDYVQNYISHIPDAFFMPRIDLSAQGHPWWGELYPAEMNILLEIETNQPVNQVNPNPAALPYLGHEVHLESLNLHSFHSMLWRQQAGEALAELIRYCEAQSYANQVWGWHICDGLFCEWFHWNEYSFGGMADYSQAAQEGFKQWLRTTYQEDENALSQAWGRQVSFDSASIPLPSERDLPRHGVFYDPVSNRPAIDYSKCFSQATADCIVSICKSVKDALPVPKVTCVFYGYQFSNMPRPQLNAHYALERVLASPYVDMIASPHSYSNRGEGGYHAPQSLAESIHRARKIHFDEIDCKTVWTPASVTWKMHISQPKTAAATIEMMKKDASYALATGTSYWWMDLTNQGWFDAPEAVEVIRNIQKLEAKLSGMDRHSSAQIALVVSQQSMHYIALHEGLHNVTQKIFRNWHLSRIGAPYDTILVDELDKENLPEYKLYIFANLFYLSAQQSAVIERKVKQKGATALWIYAPGFQDDQQASLDNMKSLTGFNFGMADNSGELDVEIVSSNHPITGGLSEKFTYGTGIDRAHYQNPPKIQYMPETRVKPIFYVDDASAITLGVSTVTRKPGLAIKSFPHWNSIYSAAPLLSWQLMQNIARFAGIHIYNNQGDMIWMNQSFLGLYSQKAGRHIIRFPSKMDITDAYHGQILGQSIDTIFFEMEKWETQLLLLQ